MFDNLLGEWYIYTSPYNTTTLDLYHYDWAADLLAGNHTKGDSVITAESDSGQADRPHAIYVPEDGELRVYYYEQGGSTGTGAEYTMLPTTPDTGDGTTVTKCGNPTPVLDGKNNGQWNDDERTYLTARGISNKYLGTYQERDQNKNECGIGVAWSDHGIGWDT